LESEEINDEPKNKNTTFLKYNELSCRYDSFMLLQIYLFNDYFIKLNINLNNNEKSLFDIGNYIYSLPDGELNKGFWTILSNSNLDKLNICSVANGFKDFYPISNIYDFLKNSDNFCINVNSHMHCQLCNYNYSKNFYYGPLISIYKNDIKMKSLKDIIFSKFNIFEGSCEVCSFDESEKIKKDDIYKICKKTFFTDLKFPPIISFILDLSDNNEIDEFQYYNLENLLNYYKHLIIEKINICDKEYILKGIINQISINHYSATLLNINNEEKNIFEGNIYYYDGKKNNNQIIQLNNENDIDRINIILSQKPLILTYIRE